jgi:hypothetical protein
MGLAFRMRGIAFSVRREDIGCEPSQDHRHHACLDIEHPALRAIFVLALTWQHDPA